MNLNDTLLEYSLNKDVQELQDLPEKAQNDVVLSALEEDCIDSPDLWLESVEISEVFQRYMKHGISSEKLCDEVIKRLKIAFEKEISDRLACIKWNEEQDHDYSYYDDCPYPTEG